MLQDIDKIVRITAEVVKSTHLPVTVKTRLGWDDKTRNIEEVAERLQDIGVAALSIHGRTRSQLYKGDADWTLIARVKNNPRIKIPIFGNGDIDTPQKALEYKDRYGVDGIMIGRAAIGYPWIFREIAHFLATGTHLPPPETREVQAWLTEHLRDHYALYGEDAGVRSARKHIGWAVRALPGGEAFRAAMNTLDDCEAQLRAVTTFFEALADTHRLLPSTPPAANQDALAQQA